MRRGLVLIWLGATAVVSAIVGFLSYGAGWAAGAAARLPVAAPPYYYYYGGPHFFGLFPFLLVLLVLFLVFRGRRMGPWGWGYRGYAPTQPPPTGDPWHGWPQRPPAAEPKPEKPAE